MVRNMLEKVQVSNNSDMDACRRIFSNSHGDNFIAAVSYLSTQVTEIFPNTQIEAKKISSARFWR